MLRWKLGDSTFFRGIRRYLNDPLLAYGTAKTQDLQRNLEAESGKDLNEFFKDWFYGEGYPNYEAIWSQQANHVVRLQLNQTTTHPSVSFFEMPVPIRFKNATRDTIITINHTFSGQMFTVDPGFAADSLIIDPQLWILSKIKTSKKLPAPVSDGDVLVYPNPVRDQFSVSYPGTLMNLHLQVFNAVGQLIYSAEPAVNTSTFDLNAQNWSSGIYWLQVTGNNFNQTRKFLVSHK